MLQNPQKKSQTALKHHNKFRNVRYEALIWSKTTTYIVKRIKVKTEPNKRYQKLLVFITIETIKI